MNEKKSRQKKIERARLPDTFKTFLQKFPALAEAHERVAKAIDQLGPLDRKTCELIKIGISLGAGLESALQSHVRRAMEHGATDVEVEQAILLGMNTSGFPRTMAAWKWAHEQMARDRGYLHDRADLKEAERRRKAARKKNEKPVPLEEAAREMGIELPRRKG